jgi:hypothetical protein
MVKTGKRTSIYRRQQYLQLTNYNNCMKNVISLYKFDSQALSRMHKKTWNW